MKGRDKNGENELDLLFVERRKKRKKERNIQEFKLKILKFEFEFQNEVVVCEFEFEFEVEEQCKQSKEPRERIKYCQKVRERHMASLVVLLLLTIDDT